MYPGPETMRNRVARLIVKENPEVSPMENMGIWREVVPGGDTAFTITDVIVFALQDELREISEK